VPTAAFWLGRRKPVRRWLWRPSPPGSPCTDPMPPTPGWRFPSLTVTSARLRWPRLCFQLDPRSIRNGQGRSHPHPTSPAQSPDNRSRLYPASRPPDASLASVALQGEVHVGPEPGTPSPAFSRGSISAAAAVPAAAESERR
jgi:hypothetical protein